MREINPSYYYPVIEIAEIYGVTKQAVGLWIKDGLPFECEKVIGRKPRRVIRPIDVDDYLNLGIRKGGRP